MLESTSTAAIAGAAALALLLLLTLLLRFFLFRFRPSSSQTGSSPPSAGSAEVKRGGGARQFGMEEMEHATMDFNEANVIGSGAFGVVFKGLLHDGTAVAIKRRHAAATQDFADQVACLSSIQHRNLVKLLGYCQERGTQMLVSEYLPNSNISTHLYGTDSTVTKLEFKQRLSIAIGAAKGLCHLHGLQPPLLHCNFKTQNVLVDENFIAKVADAGLRKLLEDDDDAGVE